MNASSLVEPTHKSAPAWYDTFGPEVAELNELAGFAPDPEQRMLLDAAFAVDRQGFSVAFEVGVVACRQNLKTGFFKQCALGWMFVTDEKLVVWSAHEWDTLKEAFRDLDETVMSYDVLRRRVKRVHRGNGDEAIELLNGTRLIFKTRTKTGGRGLSGNKVILDEAFALKPEHMGALMPTLSAKPDPQVAYGSSAGLPESAVLRGVRDRGRASEDPRLAYYEWCSPPPAGACTDGDACSHALDAEGCGCDDPELWQQANPAMGRRITREYISAERRAMPPLEFGRERMGWWDDPVEGVSPITPVAWGGCADSRSRAQDPVAFAVDVTPDRSRTALSVCGRRADERYHGELAYHQVGTGWVVDQLVESATRQGPCAVALDPSGPAGALVQPLQERGFSTDPGLGEWQLFLVTSREHAQACGALTDDVRNDQWRHPDQKPLNDAVEGAITRTLSDAWAWSRRDSGVDISPLVAVTLARLAVATYGYSVRQPATPWAVYA